VTSVLRYLTPQNDLPNIGDSEDEKAQEQCRETERELCSSFHPPRARSIIFVSYLGRNDNFCNNRQMNDGERTITGITSAEGKRLRYQDPDAERQYTRTIEKKEIGE